MPPTVILIRHAQALHNYELHDPALTDLGFGPQCEELSKVLQQDWPIAHEVELIVISPMRRTLQTAQQGLGWLMEKNVPVILRPEWQDNSAKPCDTGTNIAVMSKEWPQFDWSAVDPLYPSKTGLYENSQRGLHERGIAARKWLKSRPEKVIAVVSHSGFLRVGVNYRKYENAGFRIFNFAPEEKGDEEIGGLLVEWDLSEKKGGGLGKSPSGVFSMSYSDAPEIGEVTSEDPSQEKL